MSEENEEVVENEENQEQEYQENAEVQENQEVEENVENQENQEVEENIENQENVENQENQENEIVEENQINEEIQENEPKPKKIIKQINEDNEEKDEKENEDEQENENVDNAEEITFISRFFMQPDELYRKEKYLLSIMRISIFERILRIFLFQSTSKELSLYPFLDNVKKDPKLLKLYDATLKYISENFTEDFPLNFFNEVVNEINRITKIGDLSNMKFDKYILKLEFLLAWHFENNFLFWLL